MQHTNAAHNRRITKIKIKIKNDANWQLPPLLQKIKTQHKFKIPPPPQKKRDAKADYSERRKEKKKDMCTASTRKKKKTERENKGGDNKDAACPNQNSRVLPSTVIVAGFSPLLLDVSFYSRTRHALTLLFFFSFLFLSFTESTLFFFVAVAVTVVLLRCKLFKEKKTSKGVTGRMSCRCVQQTSKEIKGRRAFKKTQEWKRMKKEGRRWKVSFANAQLSLFVYSPRPSPQHIKRKKKKIACGVAAVDRQHCNMLEIGYLQWDA